MVEKRKYTKQCSCGGKCTVFQKGVVNDDTGKKETIWQCDKCKEFQSFEKELRFTVA